MLVIWLQSLNSSNKAQFQNSTKLQASSRSWRIQYVFAILLLWRVCFSKLISIVQLNKFQECAKSVADTTAKYVSLAKDEREYELEIRKLNDLLMLTERAFIDYNGLPNRPFFRHIVYGT